MFSLNKTIKSLVSNLLNFGEPSNIDTNLNPSNLNTIKKNAVESTNKCEALASQAKQKLHEIENTREVFRNLVAELNFLKE